MTLRLIFILSVLEMISVHSFFMFKVVLRELRNRRASNRVDCSYSFWARTSSIHVCMYVCNSALMELSELTLLMFPVHPVIIYLVIYAWISFSTPFICVHVEFILRY